MNAKYEDFKQAGNLPTDGFADFVEAITNKPETLAFFKGLQSRSGSVKEGTLPNLEITSERTPNEEPDTDKLTPLQLELGKKLLKDGNFAELCKLAEELRKQGDQSFGLFQKRLGEVAKADIEFKKDGVEITFGDNENKGRHQYKNYEKLKIKADGTLGEAYKTEKGGQDNKNVSEKTDAKAVYEKLLERIKDNLQDRPRYQ